MATVSPMVMLAVLEAGADDVGVLRVHQTALAPAASFDVMLGRDSQVPEIDPVPTAAVVVHAAAEATGHATTLTARARAAELPETTDTVVVLVPASEPAFVSVTGFVIDVTVGENVVVMSLVPLSAAPVLPIVTLDAVVPVADQSAQAADDPPATNATVRTTARSTRKRRFMRSPVFR